MSSCECCSFVKTNFAETLQTLKHLGVMRHPVNSFLENGSEKEFQYCSCNFTINIFLKVLILKQGDWRSRLVSNRKIYG